MTTKNGKEGNGFMKKFKLLVSLTLVLTLIMSVIVVAPVNAGAVKTTKAVSGAEVKTYTSVSGDYNVYTDSDLVAAFNDISKQVSGSYTIALQDDITHTGGYEINKNTITIIGNGHTINFNGLGQGLRVYSGAVLNLGQGENDLLTLCGDDKTHNEKGDPKIPDNDNPGLVYVYGKGSECNMYRGVTIKNHRGNNYLGGGVTVQSGTFNMKGGTIDNCGIDGGSVCYGGGVAVFGKGEFVMNGGTISNCYACSDLIRSDGSDVNAVSNFGGGVFVTGASTFIMNGGTVTKNESTLRGGGIAVVTSSSEISTHNEKGIVDSKVRINDGIIKENESAVGGGVCVSGIEYAYAAAITFDAVVEGSPETEISNNTNSNKSKLSVGANSSTYTGEDIAKGFNTYGGTIENNKAMSVGGGMYIFGLKQNVNINNTLINNNTVTDEMPDEADLNVDFRGNGGGVFLGGNYLGGDWFNTYINNSTINSNTSALNGGGIAVHSANGVHLKNTGINNNISGDRGAGVYYYSNNNDKDDKDKDKVYVSGANVIQDNKFNDKLNNVNVVSTTKPLYVEGSLEGSKIGLSDPRLWDDNMTDAQARDDGSAELLTNGYKANNPDVHPSKYFTSDHDTWIVERTQKTTTTVDDPNSKSYREYTVKRFPVQPNTNGYAGLQNEYVITDIQNPEKKTTSLTTNDDILQELLFRFNDSAKYSIKNQSYPSRNSIYYTITPLYNTNTSSIIIKKGPTDSSFTMSYNRKWNSDRITGGGAVNYEVSVNNQLDYANTGELILKIKDTGRELTKYSFSDEFTTTTLKYVNSDPQGNVLYEYDNDGAITAKLELVTYEKKCAQITTETGTDDEVKLIRRKTPIKFHTNNPTVTDKTTRNNELFRVYNAEKPADFAKITEDGADHSLNNKGGVDEFYNIPEFAKDEYVFAGWYTVANNDNNDKSKAFEFNTAVPSDVTDVYAHWIPVGEVRKDANDDKELPSSMNGKYKGFEMFGVQIRPEANFDSNYGDVMPGGLRFIASISESLLSKINAVHTDNKIEYGFVTAAQDTVAKVVGDSRMHIDSAKYTLQYKGKNVNGVDTLLDNATKEQRKCPNNFRYITNVDCTSQKGGYGTKVKEDHRNFNNYRLATYVVTYDKSGENKGKNVAARAYLRYTDANGLLRTFYNDYSGTNFYGGCSTNYTDVEKMATNTKTVQ